MQGAQDGFPETPEQLFDPEGQAIGIGLAVPEDVPKNVITVQMDFWDRYYGWTPNQDNNYGLDYFLAAEDELKNAGHFVLDVVGLVPLVGIPADLINGAWYAAEGDTLNASFSIVAAIPGIGYAASAMKFTGKGASWIFKGSRVADLGLNLTESGFNLYQGIENRSLTQAGLGLIGLGINGRSIQKHGLEVPDWVGGRSKQAQTAVESVTNSSENLAPKSEIAGQLTGPGQQLAGQIDSLVQSGLTGAKRLTPTELATGRRLERLLGKRLKESPHVGAEYVDDLGRTYDALGNPMASRHWNAREFFDAIDSHLRKSNDFTVIDLSGFTKSQIDEVTQYLSGLTQAQRDTIIRIGF